MTRSIIWLVVIIYNKEYFENVTITENIDKAGLYNIQGVSSFEFILGNLIVYSHQVDRRRSWLETQQRLPHTSLNETICYQSHAKCKWKLDINDLR